MVATTLREPRPGTGGAKKADFLRPGTAVTLIALAPEAGASMAVLRWTNGEGQGSKLLSPADMEVAALQELPLKPAAGDAPSALDIEAAKEAIRAMLPPGGASADTPVLVYWKDSLTGAGSYAAEGGQQMIETLQRSHAALKKVLQGVATTAGGTVLSNAMSRTLGINARNRKTEVALDTACSIFPQAADRLSSVQEHACLANALLVAAHVIGAGVVKGEAGEESAATPSEAAAAAAAAEGAEEMLTPSGRPRRKRAVTSYAESVSGGESEEGVEAAAAAAAAAEKGEAEAEAEEGEAEGEGEGNYHPPKAKRPRAQRKRSTAPKAPKPPSNFPKVSPAAAVAAAAPAAPAQSAAPPILQLQQAAGVPGVAAAAAQPAAPGGGQGSGLGAVTVGSGPQLTAQQQQQLMATYLWQLQQAMLAQQVLGSSGGGMGSPTAAGGLPASFPFAHALAQQPVLPVVGPAAVGGSSYGGYSAYGGGSAGISYPSAYDALVGSGQQAAAPTPLYGGLAGTWPQLGGTAATPAADASQPAVRAEPGQEGPTALQVQAAEQAQQAQQAQQAPGGGLGHGLPGSVSDFFQ